MSAAAVALLEDLGGRLDRGVVLTPAFREDLLGLDEHYGASQVLVCHKGLLVQLHPDRFCGSPSLQHTAHRVIAGLCAASPSLARVTPFSPTRAQRSTKPGTRFCG
jgi:hypothetical protein